MHILYIYYILLYKRERERERERDTERERERERERKKERGRERERFALQIVSDHDQHIFISYSRHTSPRQNGYSASGRLLDFC